jgi:hypothetical protein
VTRGEIRTYSSSTYIAILTGLFSLYIERLPNGVTGIFHCHNPPGRTMVLGLAQHLTEMSTRNNSWEVIAAGA